jgi:PelA/Pel-15E family pectate lyase
MFLRSSYKSAAVIILAFASLPSATAKVVGTNTPAESITPARIAQLPAAQRGAWLAYLDRSEHHRHADEDAFHAELKNIGITHPTEPPHGYGASSMPLDRDSAWYATPDALRIADNIISFQTPAGGWGKNLDVSKGPRVPGERYAPNNVSRYLSADDFDAPRDPDWNYIGTIDNSATISEIEFLAKVISAKGVAKNSPYLKSFIRGFQYLLSAQFPNGGWPQVYPLEGGYHDAITYNDNAMVQVLLIMHRIADGTDEYAFASEGLRKEAKAAFDRGIQCILATQLHSADRLAVWAQQYDALTLKPVSARNYEMPSQCSSESDDVMLLLMNELPDPSAAEQRAIRAAGAWFKKTAIYGQAYGRTSNGRGLTAQQGAGPIWARYYQLDTDKPIFGDRDKSIHGELTELSSERRNGYSWFSSEPKIALDRFATWSQQHPESK